MIDELSNIYIDQWNILCTEVDCPILRQALVDVEISNSVGESAAWAVKFRGYRAPLPQALLAIVSKIYLFRMEHEILLHNFGKVKVYNGFFM